RFVFYPSESAVSVSRTLRGGTIFPKNITSARPNPRVLGYRPASAGAVNKVRGPGSGTTEVRVVDNALVQDGHQYAISFVSPSAESIRANRYVLRDSTDHRTLFRFGSDLLGVGSGPVGDGLLPVIWTDSIPKPDTLLSGWAAGSTTNMKVKLSASVGTTLLPANLRRPGYPDSITIEFDDVIRDTALLALPGFQARGVKFRAIAHTAL